MRVPKPDTQAAAPVDCALATAGVRITRLVAQGEGAAKCPRDSDGWLDAPGGPQTACVRNRVGPHPGDPGKGGGVLQVGDCTLVEDGVGGLKKTPCKGGKAWGKVVGHVSIEFECKRPADYSVTTDTKKYGVLPAPDPYPSVTCIRQL
ncbi:hypothetical protein ABZ912_55255 [Nonomuraea angiospora]|uniref:hypothetical protein n=1 Tax=Nonomuraea angiospora TaxID=46172 RepID=UPI003402DD92